MDVRQTPGSKDNEAPVLVREDYRNSRDQIPLPPGSRAIGMIVHWEGTPNFLNAAALLDPGEEVRPGQFVGVWHGKRRRWILTVIQVANAREVNPNEVPELAAARQRLGLPTGYAEEGVSTRIFRMLEGPTIEEFEIELKGDGIRIVERRAPEQLVRAGDQVITLNSELLAQVIGAEPDPEKGVFVGSTYGTDPVKIALPNQAFQLHIGLFGNPGKGKSYCAGVLMEEAVKWGVPALALDINGEFIEAAKSVGGAVITLPDKDKFGLSLDLITAPELVEITPNVQPNTVYAELIEMSHERLRAESSGRSITFEQLCAKIEELGQQVEAKAPSIRTATGRVRNLQKDPIMSGRKFDFVAEMIESRLVVLDCRYISLRQTRLIAAAASRELQRIGRENARKADLGDAEARRWFSLLFVDEAHLVVPEEGGVVSTQVMYELARMGRHVRTGLVLSSQSPADLNQSVLKRLQTRFIFALEQDQLKRIGGVMADLDEQLVRSLPKLPTGVCAVSGSSEIVRHGFLLRVRQRETPVGGRTPSVFDGRAKTRLKR
jgi:DNA helicase HerA-like ATPase